MELTPLFEPEAPQPDPAARDAEPSATIYRRLVPVVLLAVVLVALWLAATAVRAYLYVPYSDVHDWAAEALRTIPAGNWSTYLWTPHGDQRIVTARLVEVIDLSISRGSAPTFLVAALGLWLIGGGALAALIWRSGLRLTTKLAVGVACALIATDVALAECAAFPVFAVYLFVAGPALAMACAFASSRAHTARSVMVWIALLLAGLASLGNAAGLAVWPALLAAAQLHGRDRASCLLIGLAGLAVVVGCEAGLGVPSASLGAATDSASHFVKMATYFLMFAGLPWERALRPDLVACGLGLCVWVASALILSASWRERSGEASATRQAATVLILFGALTAAMAAVGRVDELAAPIVPTRYTPFAALLQIGVILGFADRLDRRRGVRETGLGVAGLAIVTALILAGDWRASRSIPRAAQRIRAASALFDRGGTTTDVIIHPRPAFARDVRAQLRAQGLPN